MVGLVTPDEIVEIEGRKETPATPLPVLSSTPTTKSPKTTGQYSRQSGRWNETPKSAHRSRSLRRQTTPLRSAASNHLFCVDEQEREMWVRLNISYVKYIQFYFYYENICFLDASSTLSNITN
jgi:hypothetical protein